MKKTDNEDFVPKDHGFDWDGLSRSGLYILTAAFVICLIVNICVGGNPWCLYVLFSEYVFYTLALDFKPVDAGFMRRWMSVMTGVCVLLLAIEWLAGGMWATRVVVPMVSFGALLVAAVVYFSGRNRQRHNLIPFSKLIIWSALMAVLCAVRTGTLLWPVIVLISVSGAVVLFAVLCFRRQLILEFKKKFNL